MTTQERNTKLERIEALKKRIFIFGHQAPLANSDAEKEIEEVLHEAMLEKARLIKETNKRETYVYSFADGGWNTEQAYTAEEAYMQSSIRWGAGSALSRSIVKTSFRVITPEEERTLHSLFD